MELGRLGRCGTQGDTHIGKKEEMLERGGQRGTNLAGGDTGSDHRLR